MVLCHSCNTCISDFWNFKTRTARAQRKFHPPENTKVKEEPEESNIVTYNTVDIVRNFIERHSIDSIHEEGQRLIIYAANHKLNENLDGISSTEFLVEHQDEDISVKEENDELPSDLTSILNEETDELEQDCENNQDQDASMTDDELFKTTDEENSEFVKKEMVNSVTFISRVPISDRPKNPDSLKNYENWKRNKIKLARLKGEGYVTSSGKAIEARKMLAPCEGCRFKCSENVQEKDRRKAFDIYWNLGDLLLQRKYLFQHRQVQPVARRRGIRDDPNPRSFSGTYHLDTWNPDGTIVQKRVCERMFTATLGISRRIIRTVMEKALKKGVVQYNHVSKIKQRTKPEGHELAIEHVQSDPFFHIENPTTIKGMYDLYVQECQEKCIEPLHISGYRVIFNEHNPGSFLKQDKVYCDVCDRYYKATEEEKQPLHARYQEHIAIHEKCMTRAKWRVRGARKRERQKQARLVAKAQKEQSEQNNCSL